MKALRLCCLALLFAVTGCKESPPAPEAEQPHRDEEAHAELPSAGTQAKEVVSTHVLVEPEKVDQLRELSRRTRVAQSEYLREAVDDLLVKYEKLEAGTR